MIEISGCSIEQNSHKNDCKEGKERKRETLQCCLRPVAIIDTCNRISQQKKSAPIQTCFAFFSFFSLVAPVYILSTIMSGGSTVSGKCLCGEIYVSVPKDVVNKTENVGICYCRNCQQSGGCLASHNLYLSEGEVNVQGQPKLYHDPNTDSGTTVIRAFCGNCGSPLYGKNPKFPGLIAVRMGLFNEKPKPGMALYCKNRPEWERGAIDGSKEHETMPPFTEELKKWLQEKGVDI